MPNLIYEKKVVESTFSVESMKMETKEETILRVHTLPDHNEFNRYMVSFYKDNEKVEEYIESIHFKEDNVQVDFLNNLISTATRLKTPYKFKLTDLIK